MMIEKKSNVKELLFLLLLSVSILIISFYYVVKITSVKKNIFSDDINVQFQEVEKILRDDLKIYSEGFNSNGNSFSFYIYKKDLSGFDPLVSFIEYNCVEGSYLIRKKDGKLTHEFKGIKNIGCTFLEGLFKVVCGNEKEAVEFIVMPVSESIKEK